MEAVQLVVVVLVGAVVVRGEGRLGTTGRDVGLAWVRWALRAVSGISLLHKDVRGQERLWVTR
ncbi:Uncharacterised protein [Dermatophilus congolensis]|uniref:Uncharacterized protein n=1 Tax=Dermatophilus congolensis TaxID=1863 RepID=A0A239VJ26_9MICO|nr:Uncharacterised protein [Dermatophilus congolensis]